MPRPESGFGAARLFRWQMAPISQEFRNEFAPEPLSRLDGNVLRPLAGALGVVGHYHRGVDLACPAGTPIRLALSGVATVPPFDATGFGNYVQCDGARYRAIYGHLSSVRVMSGQHVVHGDLIGYSGSTGNSTGPHVHFEIYDKQLQAWVDPWLVV